MTKDGTQKRRVQIDVYLKGIDGEVSVCRTFGTSSFRGMAAGVRFAPPLPVICSPFGTFSGSHKTQKSISCSFAVFVVISITSRGSALPLLSPHSLPTTLPLSFHRPSAFLLPFKGSKKAETKGMVNRRSKEREGNNKVSNNGGEG